MQGRTWHKRAAAAVASGALAAAGPTPRAVADDSAGLPVVRANGECPRADAVARALAPLVKLDREARVHAEPPRVTDLGDRYEVAAEGQAGQYVDPARDCAERARVAAVFIALALHPPAVRRDEPSSSDRPAASAARPPPPSPPPSSPPSASPPPSPAPEKTARTSPAAPEHPAPSGGWIRAELGGQLASAPGFTSPSIATAGVELRGAFGGRLLGMTASAGLLAATLLDFDGVVVSEQRFPLSLAFRIPWRLEGIGLAMDVGAAAALFSTRVNDGSNPRREMRLDFGGHAAFNARFDAVGRLAPYVGAYVDYFPRAYTLFVDPKGKVGSTPHVWLGASLGISLALE